MSVTLQYVTFWFWLLFFRKKHFLLCYISIIVWTSGLSFSLWTSISLFGSTTICLLFTSWRTFGLFPALCYYEETVTHRSLCGHMFSFPLNQFQDTRLLDTMAGTPLLYKILPTFFSNGPYNFSVPTTKDESFSCFISLSALGIVNVFNFSHSSRCVVVSHFGFNLHFPND